MTTLADKIEALGASIEAGSRCVYGFPVAAMVSDTHNKMALWCDNGMAGVGQVCVSVNIGEFPDQQLTGIAGLSNAAMSMRPLIPTILRALRERDQAVEALRRISNHRYDAGGAYEMCKIARATLATLEGTGHE